MPISQKTYKKALDALKELAPHPMDLEFGYIDPKEPEQVVGNSFFEEYSASPQEASELKRKLIFERILEGDTGYDQDVFYHIAPFQLYRFYDLVFPSATSPVEFHGDPRAISFGGRSYKIRGKEKASFFSVLWDKRKEVDSQSRTSTKGEPVSKGAIAVNIDMVDSSQKLPKEVSLRIKNMISDLNHEFKRHGFPMRINSLGGIQLIINYSHAPKGWEKDWNSFVDREEESSRNAEKLAKELGLT